MHERGARTFVQPWRLDVCLRWSNALAGFDSHATATTTAAIARSGVLLQLLLLLMCLLLDRVSVCHLFSHLIFVISCFDCLDSALNVSLQPVAVLVPQFEHMRQCMCIAFLVARLAGCDALSVECCEAEGRGAEESVEFIFGCSKMCGASEGGRFLLSQAGAEVGEIHHVIAVLRARLSLEDVLESGCEVVRYRLY